ncbi:hypothetical protein CH63R_11654 [Colletotrichum higginsianum IMI 349063]|uniref:Uncharacterized protein n=1 Tax=Colletotrichum higginsianum (strain IMI 349063) TaxID=759273 RepID=A0A1B7XYZ2_COLHI|nr:hypothetical protein CH63R_11654 [Colletotrichum higginsianum IMI 349063]OBR04951.1 hypothetical protein CH63R_11654 [Colletotrichum higginsianum IMI 349063]
MDPPPTHISRLWEIYPLATGLFSTSSSPELLTKTARHRSSAPACLADREGIRPAHLLAFLGGGGGAAASLQAQPGKLLLPADCEIQGPLSNKGAWGRTKHRQRDPPGKLTPAYARPQPPCFPFLLQRSIWTLFRKASVRFVVRRRRQRG